MPPRARTTSKPSGAAATCCASRTRRRRESRLSLRAETRYRTPAERPGFSFGVSFLRQIAPVPGVRPAFPPPPTHLPETRRHNPSPLVVRRNNVEWNSAATALLLLRPRRLVRAASGTPVALFVRSCFNRGHHCAAAICLPPA